MTVFSKEFGDDDIINYSSIFELAVKSFSCRNTENSTDLQLRKISTVTLEMSILISLS